MKSPHHIIKCQCTKKQRAFFYIYFFQAGTKLALFTYETAHTFSFSSPPISTLHYSATGISYRDLASPALTPTSLERRGDAKVSTESGPVYSDFSGLYPVNIFRDFIQEQQNHPLALNTNKHSISTGKPFQSLVSISPCYVIPKAREEIYFQHLKTDGPGS